MSILDRCQALFQTARKGETRLPSRVSIPSSHVDDPERLGPPLEPDRHYFQVRVNEMFLSHARQWYAAYDPLVFVGSEFIYDKAETAVPVMVGPSLLERFGKKRDLPGGTVFEDTRVAGLHPYRGGRLAVISFHSLEDRAVKTTMHGLAHRCVCPPGLPVCGCGREDIVRLVTTRPVSPGASEVASNPRARSAKLRIVERL